LGLFIFADEINRKIAYRGTCQKMLGKKAEAGKTLAKSEEK